MLMVQGYSQKEIAQKLSVSPINISKIVRRIYAKFGANNAVDCIRECMTHNLLTVEDLRRLEHEPETL